MVARDRPQYHSSQSAPAASASASIGSIGVMPMPPAMNRYAGEPASGKWLRGPRTRTAAPTVTRSWTNAEPPRPSCSRSTPIRMQWLSDGLEQSEYWRISSGVSSRSTCAPGVQAGSAAPPGSRSVMATTSCATCSASVTTRSPSCSRTVVWARVIAAGLAPGGDADREALDAVDEVAAHPDDVPGLLDRGNAGQQRLEHDPHLHPGQVRPQAGVRPLPERHVVVREPGQVKAVRVGERGGIPVAGGEPDDDLVARLDLLAVQFGIAGGGPPEVVDRGGPAEQLLDGDLRLVRVVAQVGELVWIVDQGLHRVADRLPGGLVASHDQQQEVVVEVGVAERDPVLGNPVDQFADQVIALATAPLRGQLAAVLEDLL